MCLDVFALLTAGTGAVVLVAAGLRAHAAVVAGGGAAGVVHAVAVLPGPAPLTGAPSK